MDNFQKVFIKFKKLDLSKAAVSLYIVHRTMYKREAKYTVAEVAIKENLSNKLLGIVNRSIVNSNTVSEYEFITGDQDNSLLNIPASETDFEAIECVLQEGDIGEIEDPEEMVKAHFYIVCLTMHEISPIYAIRQVSDSWTAKKVKSYLSLRMQNKTLVDLEEDKIFRISNSFDFFSFEKEIFILSKTRFESAMNFRDGMIKNRNEIINEFGKRRIVDDPGKFGKAIGDNMRYLRKLSMVKNAGYYKDADYMTRLRSLAGNDGWDIKFDQAGSMVVTDDNVKDILIFLNNDRLISEVNDERFNVEAKKSVPKSQAKQLKKVAS